MDDELYLQREDNEYDENAILVLTAGKKKLGYVPEKDNIVFSRLMDAGKKLTAKIKRDKAKERALYCDQYRDLSHRHIVFCVVARAELTPSDIFEDFSDDGSVKLRG